MTSVSKFDYDYAYLSFDGNVININIIESNYDIITPPANIKNNIGNFQGIMPLSLTPEEIAYNEIFRTWVNAQIYENLITTGGWNDGGWANPFTEFTFKLTSATNLNEISLAFAMSGTFDDRFFDYLFSKSSDQKEIGFSFKIALPEEPILPFDPVGKDILTDDDEPFKIGDLTVIKTIDIDTGKPCLEVTVAFLSSEMYDWPNDVSFEAQFDAYLDMDVTGGTIDTIKIEFSDSEGWELDWNYTKSGGSDDPVDYKIKKEATSPGGGDGSVDYPYTSPYINYKIIATSETGDLSGVTISDILATGGSLVYSDLDLELLSFDYTITTTATAYSAVTVSDANALEAYIDTEGTIVTFNFPVGEHVTLATDEKVKEVIITLHTRVLDDEYIGAMLKPTSDLPSVENKATLTYSDDGEDETIDSDETKSHLNKTLIEKDGGGITPNSDILEWTIEGNVHYVTSSDSVYIVDFIENNNAHDYEFDTFKITYPDGDVAIGINEWKSNPTGTLPTESLLYSSEAITNLFTANPGYTNIQYKVGDLSVAIIKLESSRITGDEIDFTITYDTKIKSAYLASSGDLSFENKVYLLIVSPEGGGWGPPSDNKPPYGEAGKEIEDKADYIFKECNTDSSGNANSQRATWKITATARANSDLKDCFIFDTISTEYQTFKNIMAHSNASASGREIYELTPGTWYGINSPWSTGTGAANNPFTNVPLTGVSISESDCSSFEQYASQGYIGCYKYSVDTTTKKSTLTVYFKKIDASTSYTFYVATKVVYAEWVSGKLGGINASDFENTVKLTAKNANNDLVNPPPKTAEKGVGGTVWLTKTVPDDGIYDPATNTIKWNISLLGARDRRARDLVITDIFPDGMRYVREEGLLSNSAKLGTLQFVEGKPNTDGNYQERWKVISDTLVLKNREIVLTEYYVDYTDKDGGYYYYTIDFDNFDRADGSLLFDGFDAASIAFQLKGYVYDFSLVEKVTENGITMGNVLNQCYIDGQVLQYDSDYYDKNNYDSGGWVTLLNPGGTDVKDIWKKKAGSLKSEIAHKIPMIGTKIGIVTNEYIGADGTPQTMDHIQWKAEIPIRLYAPNLDPDPHASIDEIVVEDIIKHKNLIMDIDSFKIYLGTGDTKELIEDKSPDTDLSDLGIEFTEKGFKFTLTGALLKYKGKTFTIEYNTFIMNIEDEEDPSGEVPPDEDITFDPKGENRIEVTYKGESTKTFVTDGTITYKSGQSASASGTMSFRPIITINKVNSDDDTPISEVVFTVKEYKIDSLTGTVANVSLVSTKILEETNIAGVISYAAKSQEGYLYVITEDSVPSGYTQLINPIYVVVGRTDIISGYSLNGAEPTIGIPATSLINLQSGHMYTYTIEEIEDSGTKTIKYEMEQGSKLANSKKYGIRFVIKNAPIKGGPAFPLTGGIGRETTATIGIGLLLTSALASTVILAPNRKKDKDTESKLPKSRKRK